jgi:fatty acid desaturase
MQHHHGWTRPPNLFEGAMHYIGLLDMAASAKTLICNAFGDLSPAEKSYIPESEWPKEIFAARIHVLIQLAAIAAALWMWSLLPLMLVGLPRIYSCWHMFMTGLLQHGGLAEDVVDHRLNSRTVYMNPISRWTYWNMNYHVEHHMFPMVPFHALTRLHELIKDDLPESNPSIANAYLEMVTALLRQRTEPEYYFRRDLPLTAKPYREVLHTEDSVPSA